MVNLTVEEDSIFHIDDQNRINEVWDSMNGLRKNDQLCDVVLLAGNKRFRVHRAILAANSDYFRSMFLSANGAHRGKASEIQLSSVNEEMIRLILDYIYARKVLLTPQNVTQLLPTAEAFGMPGLRNACCEFLEEQLSFTNCIGILNLAERHSCSNLQTSVRKFILNNFCKVASCSIEFLELPVEILAELVADDHLNASQEEQVFEALIRWVDYAANERASSIPGLLLCVRLGLVHPNYFLDHIGRHSYIKDNEACTEIIQTAWDMLYSMERTGREAVIKPNSPLVRPRVPHEVIFALGGWSGGAPIAYFETYDARADRWFIHSSIEDDSPRAYHGMVELNNKIYMLGGFDGQKYYNSMSQFDPVTCQWEEVAPMHVHRCYVSTVSCGGFIYACGGYDGRWRLDIAERYNPTTNQWSLLPAMKSKRSDSGAAAVNGKVYIVGGFDGEQCLNSVDVFDPEVSQWSLLEHSMSIRRSGVSAVFHGGYFYALGGFDGERRLVSCERYCPESGRWAEIPDMMAARSNFAVAVLDERIFCIGGFNGNHTISQVEYLDSQVDTWHDASDMNINRSALKAVVIQNLPNAPFYTYHGYQQRKTQEDVSGDDVTGDATSSKASSEQDNEDEPDIPMVIVPTLV